MEIISLGPLFFPTSLEPSKPLCDGKKLNVFSLHLNIAAENVDFCFGRSCFCIFGRHEDSLQNMNRQYVNQQICNWGVLPPIGPCNFFVFSFPL